MGEVTDKVVRHAPCDLITVKLLGDRPIRRILIPTAGSHHATLAAEYVNIFRNYDGYEVTCCYVVKPDAKDHERDVARQLIYKTVRATGLTDKTEMLVLDGKRVATTLVKAAEDYDLLVLGASREGIFSSVLFGDIPEKVARYSHTPVMIVKRHEGRVKSIIKKLLG